MEGKVLEFLIANFPSIIVASLISGVWMKVRGFVTKLDKVAKRVERIREVCRSLHPEKGADLYKENGDD